MLHMDTQLSEFICSVYEEVCLNLISLKLFSYKPKMGDIILDDKVKVDVPWKDDPCEKVVHKTKSWV